MKKAYQLIDSTEKLIYLQKAVEVSHYVAIDTEFVRRTTYYAKLALIQIKAHDEIFLIDPLQCKDLSYIGEILQDESITKIFHAPQQDFEIFFQLFKKLPQNIFDTQLAAKFCNLGRSLSYRDLCKELLGADIDKTLQKCDWAVRPMTKEMYEYAAADVDNLSNIYEILYNILRTNDHMKDFQHASETLIDPQKYIVDYELSWKKVKFSNRNHRFLQRMKRMAAFREETAAKLNIPRGHFLTDKDLINLCYNLPMTSKELSKLRINSKWLKENHKENLLNVASAITEAEEAAQ